MSQCPKCGRTFRGQSIGTHATACRVTEPELFWMYVTRGDGCWLWTGAKHRDGYGRFNARTGMVIAHRYVWTLHHGAIPAGMDVCHTCDNRQCVNPAHLWLGTHVENMADSKLKDRHSRGERNRRNKLVAAQVLEIRANPPKLGGRWTEVRECAARYGVTPGAIYCIITRRSWAHLASPDIGNGNG